MRRLAVALLVVPVVATLLVLWLAPLWLLEADYARLRWQSGLVEREIGLGEHRWRYLEGGRGPTLVLVHGFTGSKENWLMMTPYFQRSRIVAVDLPGWGESDRLPDADYGVRAQAERLRGFLDALDLRDVALVGHSMGGHIAGVLASEHPGRLRALVLMNASGVAFEENDFARRIAAGDNPFSVETPEDFDRWLDQLFAQRPWIPQRVVHALGARQVAQRPFLDALMAQLARGPDTFLLQGRLASIHVPTLVLWCDGDRILDVSAVRVLERDLPDVESVVLEGCGHMPMMEMPEQTAAALEAFIRDRARVEGSVRAAPGTQ